MKQLLRLPSLHLLMLIVMLFVSASNSYAQINMKKVVLCRNITTANIKGKPQKNINLLTQSMISEPNTKYVISSDYSLGGSKITIPANCILDFDAGSICDGTLIGQQTSIVAPPKCIFGSDITIQGTFNAPDYLCEWFNGDVERCINSFGNISFIQETVISKPVHIRKWATIHLKAAHSIKVSDDFVGEYLFNAFLDVEDSSKNRYYFNPNLEFTGNGLIDLNNKTCLLKALPVKAGVSGMLKFNDVTCIKAAKSLNNSKKVAIVWTNFITNCITSQFSVERFRKAAQDPDYGFNLLGSDNRFAQTYVVLSTIGFYNCGGSSVFDQVHVWGAPKICFYITGNCSFSNCYSDWGRVAYYYDGNNQVSISNHFFIGPSKTDERYKNYICYAIKTRKKSTTLRGEITFAQSSYSKHNLLGFGEPEGETTPYITSSLRWSAVPSEWYNMANDSTPANFFMLQQPNTFRVEVKPGQLCLLVSPFGPYNRGVHCSLFNTETGAEYFQEMLLTDKFVHIKGAIPHLSFYDIDNKLYVKNDGSRPAWFYFDTSNLYPMAGLLIADGLWNTNSYPSDLKFNTPLPITNGVIPGVK